MTDTSSHRAIDDAMAQDRPAKEVVRNWWVEEVIYRSAVASSREVPYYLSLPGGHGLDIKKLIEAGIIRRTEAGPIASEDADKLVAVESNIMAAAQLRATIPGLNVIQRAVEDLIGGTSIINYPAKKDRRAVKAAVVNLDYTAPWKVSDAGFVKTLDVVDKFGHLHERTPEGDPIDWTLCLTVNANLIGNVAAIGASANFVLDQIADCPELTTWVTKYLEQKAATLAGDPESYDSWSVTDKQYLLLILIPLKIIALGCPRGWRVHCVHAAAYGGESDNVAPMVTFIIRFDFEELALSQPGRNVQACKVQLETSLCAIKADGTVTTLSSGEN